MFNPDADYGRNLDGQPEYGTITLTIDHVSANPLLGDDVVQKMVLSTQDLISAIVAQAIYFGQPDLLANPSHGRLLRQSGSMANPVFVYLTPREEEGVRTIQVVTSTATWDILTQHPDFGKGSSLLATEALQSVVAQAMSETARKLGGFPILSVIDLSPEALEQAQTSDADATAQSGGNTAEQLAHAPETVVEEVE